MENDVKEITIVFKEFSFCLNYPRQIHKVTGENKKLKRAPVNEQK